jgi:hypothetical protein
MDDVQQALDLIARLAADAGRRLQGGWGKADADGIARIEEAARLALAAVERAAGVTAAETAGQPGACHTLHVQPGGGDLEAFRKGRYAHKDMRPQ